MRKVITTDLSYIENNVKVTRGTDRLKVLVEIQAPAETNVPVSEITRVLLPRHICEQLYSVLGQMLTDWPDGKGPQASPE